MANTYTVNTVISTTSLSGTGNFTISTGNTSSTYTVGNNIVDAALLPYMAETIVSFGATNMRPNTKFYVFFDSDNVTNLCAPGTKTTDTSIDKTTSSYVVQSGAIGANIVSDANGHVYGLFYLPGQTYRVGERAIELADVSDINIGANAITSMSRATFVGYDLSLTRELKTTTSAVQPPSPPPSTPVVNTEINYDVSTIPFGSWALFGDPLAQSFYVNVSGTSTVQLTSIDLYFQQKSFDANHGFTLYVCELNNGTPDITNIIPYSVKHIDYSNVNIDASYANTVTHITFESPILLSNKTYYAFVIAPDNSDPDYRVWSAKLGDSDVLTGQQVYQSPSTGSIFKSQNQQTWVAVPDEYIKFTLYYASFTQSTGSAVFENSAQDTFYISQFTYANNSVGFNYGDMIYKAANSSVLPNTSIHASIDYYDTEKSYLHAYDSNGLFNPGDFVQIHRLATPSSTANSSTLIAYATITDIVDPLLDALKPNFAIVSPPSSTLAFNFKGTSNAYSTDASYVKIPYGSETELVDMERIAVSKSNEVLSTANSKTSFIKIDFDSSNQLVSPFVDTIQSNILALGNIIDPISYNAYDEFYNYGTAKSKVITQIITLNPNQDAEDLQIYISAYKPVGSEILVYAKLLNGQDPDSITTKTWTPLFVTSPTLYSDYRNTQDFKEYLYVLPAAIPSMQMTGNVSVSSSSNVVTGTGTNFTSILAPNRYIQVGSDVRKVTSVANDISVTVDSVFSATNTSINWYMIAPPTTGYVAANTTTQLTGNVAISNTTNIVTGTGTQFLSQASVGQILNVGIDTLRIVSIANNTSLTTELPFSQTSSNNTGYIITNSGLTYAGSSGALYNTYITFQIKIVLFSNDSSKVPHIDDVRVLALQL